MNKYPTKYTPRSLISPLAGLAMFKKTKKKSWNFDGRAARSKQIPDTRATFDVPPEMFKPVRIRVARIKFSPQKGEYQIFGQKVKGTFADVKLVGKTLGFTHVKLGGFKPVKI